ncbi:RNA-binding domain-containing protein [Trametopsis cervina]|nr:RNA-binding domain-containing protein [Trametopsis cervina]
MEEGTKTKKTLFVGNLADDVDEAVLLDTFSTFGDVIEVQIPPATTDPNRQSEERHKGYGFVTFGSPADAQDAIDNMDLNELRGRVLRVNLARPSAIPAQGMGNRAVWESEDWIKQHAKPLARSGGAALRGQGQAADGTESAAADGEDENAAMEE